MTRPAPLQWPAIVAPHQLPGGDSDSSPYSPIYVQLPNGRTGWVIEASVMTPVRGEPSGTCVVHIDGGVDALRNKTELVKIRIDDIRTLKILPARWPDPVLYSPF